MDIASHSKGYRKKSTIDVSFHSCINKMFLSVNILLYLWYKDQIGCEMIAVYFIDKLDKPFVNNENKNWPFTHKKYSVDSEYHICTQNNESSILNNWCLSLRSILIGSFDTLEINRNDKVNWSRQLKPCRGHVET